MRTGLVADALRMAASPRIRLDGAVFHCDHGTQYAACESFHASLKHETLQGAHYYGDSDTCRRTVFAWLTRYNTRRRHSDNGHLSANEYEHHTAKLVLAA
ncbi:integrase core domain-containing protein [Streptomyces sp. NBC_00401]|uniref:integrase core domain-containing protein n=1 Tax=unclassified Streptomyces TaxID=2593676 RepID=UPI002258AB23|nr:integrase core domain-containing protein [Streptomyces sp. NBC_00401]MCX5083847.1 integrase core domain-containing protein [Streptomyces sp. NBC_00401]